MAQRETVTFKSKAKSSKSNVPKKHRDTAKLANVKKHKPTPKTSKLFVSEVGLCFVTFAKIRIITLIWDSACAPEE